MVTVGRSQWPACGAPRHAPTRAAGLHLAGEPPRSAGRGALLTLVAMPNQKAASPLHRPSIGRRRFVAAAAGTAALPWLAGCSTPLPLNTSAPASADGAARLLASAQAHGLAAYRNLTDINVSYGGQWRPLINRVQPEVVDAGYRGAAQDRLLPALGVVAQSHTGELGRKHVFWQRPGPGLAAVPGEVGVWFNGVASTSEPLRTAAAVVAECYGLFLLGPLWLADRGLPAWLDGTERVDGRLCDVLHLWLRPGLGPVPADRVTLCIDRADDTTRRMRFTLEGFAGTRGAVAQTDTFEHQRRFGVLWPMRLFESVVHPLYLPAHDWFVSGLDVNRGHGMQALRGPAFTGAAAAPAATL